MKLSDRIRSNVPLNPLASAPLIEKPAQTKTVSKAPKSKASEVKPADDVRTERDDVRTDRKAKEPVTMRLDADLLAAIKATGPGWQTRLNDLIRTYFKPNQF